MTGRSASKIGNPASALGRALRFIQRHRDYIGAAPQRVILFAEDFDALAVRRINGIEIVRGPSVVEYRT